MSYHNPNRKSTNNAISHVAIATRMLIAIPQYQGISELINCLKSFQVSTLSLFGSLRTSCRNFKCSATYSLAQIVLHFKQHLKETGPINGFVL